MTEQLTLPTLVAGDRREPSGDTITFTYEGGYEVVLPRATLDDAKLIAATDRSLLREVPLDDLTIFFEAVRDRWNNPDEKWRKINMEWSCHVTGFSYPIVARDVMVMVDVLRRSEQYDLLEADLGDPSLLDDWNRTKAIYHRCWPKGLILHVMVGNVPLASLFTLWRSLITKNVTVAKVPRRDVVSALCFANCIYDTDPNHPVTRSLSTLYWEPESEIEDYILQASDVVSVWGRGDSVESLKRRLPYGTDFIEFGPKRSFGLLLEGIEDWDNAGMRAGFDVIMYDQEGCFSMQEAYVVGEPDAFADALAHWLGVYAGKVPVGRRSPDLDAHVHRARAEAAAQGWRVLTDGTLDWTIVVTDSLREISERPLTRFVYVQPVRSVDEVVRCIDRDVQTVAIEPWDRQWEVADLLTAAGADRIVRLGRMARFSPGFIHDGFHPLRQMVRWVSLERANEYKYRFGTLSVEEDEKWVYQQLYGFLERDGT